jgi:CheY-like chemotaxis protein
VGLRTTTLGLFGAACWLWAAPLAAQPPAPPGPGQPRTPAEIFRTARELIRDGRFDVAADTLRAFLAANPTDQDFLNIMRSDPLIFQRLRRVPVWSEEPTAQADALRMVEEIIRRSEQANVKLYTDPARIDKFVRNLGATSEERTYAIDQLRRAREAAVPVMVRVLRTSTDVEQRVGILQAVSQLGIETVPGFLAAVDGLTDDLKHGILRALTARPDVLTLPSSADTNFLPHLWYYSANRSAEAKNLRDFAAALLEQYTGADLTRRRPEVELTRLAEPFVRHEARFVDPNKIRLWNWDAAKQDLTVVDATRAQAEEYYGVRYLRWALEINPAETTAQEQFLALTVERAVQRGSFGSLSQTDQAVFQIAAAAQTGMLVTMLERALAAKNTALAFGLTQVLAARADPAAAVGPSPGQPGVLVRALDYSDPRVPFAAAIGLLRTPGASAHGRSAQVVEILKRAIAVKPDSPDAKQSARALIVDPVVIRGDKFAGLLHQLGYATEQFATGRDLLRRIARAADFDLIIIDRHVPDPLARDLLAQIRADRASTGRPILLVASADKPAPPSLEQLLLRLAVLIAASETADVTVPPPFALDPRKPQEVLAKERVEIRFVRDNRLTELYDLRLARLRRLIEAAALPINRAVQDYVDLRARQFTYAALAAEYGVSADSAPETFKQYDNINRQTIDYARRNRLVENVPTASLLRLAEGIDTALDDARRQRVDLYLARLTPEALGVVPGTGRDPVAEDEASRVARNFPGVHVIPEPFSLVGLTQDIRSASEDPSQLPRDPTERRLASRLAVEWLRRMAIGEVDGYDIRPAGDALRQALKDDELADPAVDAVGRLPSAEAQQDLVFLALSPTRPLSVRIKAAERAIQHIQQFGRLTPASQADALLQAAKVEKDSELRARIIVIHQLIAGKPGDLGKLMQLYPPPLPKPAVKEPPAPAPGDPEKKEELPKK